MLLTVTTIGRYKNADSFIWFCLGTELAEKRPFESCSNLFQCLNCPSFVYFQSWPHQLTFPINCSRVVIFLTFVNTLHCLLRHVSHLSAWEVAMLHDFDSFFLIIVNNCFYVSKCLMPVLCHFGDKNQFRASVCFAICILLCY